MSGILTKTARIMLVPAMTTKGGRRVRKIQLVGCTKAFGRWSWTCDNFEVTRQQCTRSVTWKEAYKNESSAILYKLGMCGGFPTAINTIRQEPILLSDLENLNNHT